MRPSRLILFWVSVIVVLLFVEVAEITHVFTLPVQSLVGYLFSFIFALVFTTVLALVGAIFIGVYISQRLQSPTGFTPFEEEMLKMRADLQAVKRQLEALQPPREGAPSGGENPPEAPP
ncbi:MAG: hypothetical protein L3K19_08720 [Thermoplasmata archaeon]|nr:hypothetical protein [Thermoplasmata archaeon]